MTASPPPTVTASWYAGNNNFGDCLMPYYGRAYGFNVRHTGMSSTRLVCIGSILEEFAHARRPGVVWSTGLHFANSTHDLSKDRVLALRGKLTRARVKLPPGATPVIGDGGLLVATAYKRLHGGQLPAKKYKLGVVPHYVDQAWVRDNCKALAAPETAVVVIDVLSGVENVLHLIAQCEHVVSSSLHGMVAADSFGIPNRQFHCPTSKGIQSKMFKYNDYYSAFGMKAPPPLKLCPDTTVDACVRACLDAPAERPGMAQIKRGLEQTLLKLPRVLAASKESSARPTARTVPRARARAMTSTSRRRARTRRSGQR